MDIFNFKNKKDKILAEHQSLKVVSLGLLAVNMCLAYMLVSRIDVQKVVVMPPFVTLQEFWTAGDQVSDSYLEMVADGITFNALNVSPERKPNTEFLYSMTPPEYYGQVKGAIDAQIKFLQNNAINQVFYTTGYETKQKGTLKVKGLLKRYVGDKRMESSMHTLEIGYFIKGGRFWLKSIELKMDGEKPNQNEETVN